MNIPTLINDGFNRLQYRVFFSKDFYYSIMSFVVISVYRGNINISFNPYSQNLKRFLVNVRYYNDNRLPDASYLKIKNVKSEFFNTIKYYQYFDNNISPFGRYYLGEADLNTSIQIIDSAPYNLSSREKRFYLRNQYPPFYLYSRIDDLIDNTLALNILCTETTLFLINLLFSAYELMDNEKVINEWIALSEWRIIENIHISVKEQHKNSIKILENRLEKILNFL